MVLIRLTPPIIAAIIAECLEFRKSFTYIWCVRFVRHMAPSDFDGMVIAEWAVLFGDDVLNEYMDR